MGSDLTWRQKAFVSYMGPRGIVAAAVASLFATELDHAGVPGGTELRALVFLVIAVTVTVSGLTGGLVATILGVKRPANAGWIVLGAHAMARKVAQVLQAGGEEVLLVDINPENCRKAEEAGIRVIQGNAMRETVLGRAEPDTRIGAIGLTRNEEVNFLFVQKVRQQARLDRLYVGLSDERSGVTPEMVHKVHGHVLFGGAHDVERWSTKVEAGQTRVVQLTFGKHDEPVTAQTVADLGEVIPLVVMRGGALVPVGDQTVFRRRDDLVVLVDTRREQFTLEGLAGIGFSVRDRKDGRTGDDATGEVGLADAPTETVPHPSLVEEDA